MRLNENLILSNMLHRPMRTLTSITGIACGVLLIVFTVGLANGTIRKQAQREANVGAEIMVRAAGSRGMSGSETFHLPVSLAVEFARIDGVRDVVPLGQNSVASSDSYLGSRLVDGIEFNDYARLTGLQMIEGHAIGDAGDEAIIDTAWQNEMHLKVGDVLRLYDSDFTIVGTYEPAAGARIKIPLKTMQTQLGAENRCTTILVAVKDGYSAEQVAKNIDEQFPEHQIIFSKDLEEIYMSSVPALGIFLNVVIGIAAVISTLIILLTMYTTVAERKRQIGILKSLGMSNWQIVEAITKEAMLISLIGMIVGTLAALLLKLGLMHEMTLEIEMRPIVLAAVLFVGSIGGAVGAIYPALRAARLDVVDALAYE
jgi:putative ABC transport system permease protein